MERKTIVEKRKREILYFAQDVFNYLSKRRFYKNEISKASEKSHYHDNIGKGTLYRLHVARRGFRAVCNKQYPDGPLGSRGFVSWFCETLNKNFPEIHKNPFTEVIETLGYMFEAVVYAAEKGHTNLYKILPFMWTEYFMDNLNPIFYEKGGWHCLMKEGRATAVRYERFFVTSEPGAVELLSGLKLNDPTCPDEWATQSSDPAKQVPVPYMLQKAGLPPTLDETSNLGKTVKGLVDLKLEGILKPLKEAIELSNTPGATCAEELPGCREHDDDDDDLMLLSDYLQRDSPSDSCPSSPEKTGTDSTRSDLLLPKSGALDCHAGSEPVLEPSSKIDESEKASKPEVRKVPLHKTSEDSQGARRKTKHSSRKKKN